MHVWKKCLNESFRDFGQLAYNEQANSTVTEDSISSTIATNRLTVAHYGMCFFLKMDSFAVWKVKKVIYSCFKASASTNYTGASTGMNVNTYHTCYDSKELQSIKWNTWTFNVINPVLKQSWQSEAACENHICYQICVNGLSDCESTNALLHRSLIKTWAITSYVRL